MFQNYVKIALRQLWKHKLFSAINIFGFASGLMVCFLTIAHIKVVFSYDDFHPKQERIYRIITEVSNANTGLTTYATTPLSLAPTLKQDYPFLEEAVRYIPLSRLNAGRSFLSNDKQLNIEAAAVDPGFFKLFGFRFAQGRPAVEPLTAVITPKTAHRLFGGVDPIGQVIQHKTLGLVTITGVLTEPPLNSHFKFDALFSLASFPQAFQPSDRQQWKYYKQAYTYVLLKPATPVNQLEQALPSLLKRAWVNLPASQKTDYHFQVQPLTQLSPATQQLSERMVNEKSYTELGVEFLIGLITLLLAGFNYVNLTVARSIGRAREVGLRKVVGAMRWQLMSQFMAESVMVALLAVGLAYGMATLVRPLPAVQLWLISGQRWDAQLWLFLIGFVLVAGALAGWAPAQILSGFQPAQVLRSFSGLGLMRGLSFQKVLIVVQFIVSLVAMILLVTLYRQFHYVTTADYGFRREQLLTLPLNAQPRPGLIQALSQVAGVEQVSASSALLNELNQIRQVRVERTRSDSSRVVVVDIDSNFVKTMGLSLLAGHNFPHQTGLVASRFVLINEEAVRALRLGNPAQAIGHTLWLNDSLAVQVAGVLKNFRFSFLAQPIQPLLMQYQPDQFRYLSLAITKGTEEAVLAQTKRIWQRQLPYEPFLGTWYDAYLSSKYDNSQFTDFLAVLIGLSLSIASLGLLGIVTYNLQGRIKEVGIRKVMGATVGQLVTKLSWEFGKLLVTALLLAYPLGYLAGSALLQNFAYRVSVGLETFGLCVGVLLILGGLTIGLKTYRAAQASPTDSLRTE
ncbi:ABC transporter permease [Spirosoma migulaei]